MRTRKRGGVCVVGMRSRVRPQHTRPRAAACRRAIAQCGAHAIRPRAAHLRPPRHTASQPPMASTPHHTAVTHKHTHTWCRPHAQRMPQPQPTHIDAGARKPAQPGGCAHCHAHRRHGSGHFFHKFCGTIRLSCVATFELAALWRSWRRLRGTPLRCELGGGVNGAPIVSVGAGLERATVGGPAHPRCPAVAQRQRQRQQPVPCALQRRGVAHTRHSTQRRAHSMIGRGTAQAQQLPQFSPAAAAVVSLVSGHPDGESACAPSPRRARSQAERGGGTQLLSPTPRVRARAVR